MISKVDMTKLKWQQFVFRLISTKRMDEHEAYMQLSPSEFSADQ